MATIAPSKTRRSSYVASQPWVTLPTKPLSSMAEVAHDLAVRELLRNAPEVFTDGVLAGMAPKEIPWEDYHSGTEVAIIKEGMKLKNFNEFLSVMTELFPSASEEESNVHRKKVLLWAIYLWNKVCSLKEKQEE